MKVNIGGDRLGSGSKESVNMRNYNRSSHDLSYTWRSSMAPGTLVPFMNEVALPGDNWDITLDADVKTYPTVGPLFGSFKLQMDVFQVPIRLYNARLHMNELGIGMEMDKVKLPQYELVTNWNTAFQPADYWVELHQVNPSALFRYLGISGIGGGTTTHEGYLYRDFNAVPFLAYYDIFKNYYANKQEDKAYAIQVDSTTTGSRTTGAGVFADGYSNSCYNKDLVVSDFSEVESFTIRFEPGSDQPNIAQIQILVDGAPTPATDVMTNWGYFQNTGGLIGSDPILNGQTTVRVNTQNVPNENVLDISKIKLKEFDLKNIDDMRKEILRWNQDDVAFTIPNDNVVADPYNWPRFTVQNPNPLGANPRAVYYSQQGLCVKTYQSDLFNNWIDTAWIDGTGGINEITAVDTSSGNFTMDALNLAKKVYIMLNRIAISGGSYDDWLDAVYTHERRRGTENPVYHGSLIKEIAFQEVVSNAEAGAEEGNLQPLGTLAGRGRLTGKHKGGRIKIKVDEPSYIMGIVSITPRIDYSQGNRWDVNLKTLDDFHKPALDAIGYQDLITDQMSYLDTTAFDEDDKGDIIFRSAGKQPAWINYMTNYNRTYGNFADINKDMFMTLNRRYDNQVGVNGIGGVGIADLTTYVDPDKFNFIFAQSDLSAQNFWVQIANKITARRKMSAKVIPNL